jgi:hypothetical protein
MEEFERKSTGMPASALELMFNATQDNKKNATGKLSEISQAAPPKPPTQ